MPSIAMAASTWSPRRNYKPLGVVLSSTGLGNGALTPITLNQTNARNDPTGWSTLTFVVNHTGGDATTDLSMVCTGSLDGGTTKGILQNCTTASGQCASNDASWLKEDNASGTWVWRVGVLGFTDAECILTIAGDVSGTNAVTVQGAYTDE